MNWPELLRRTALTLVVAAALAWPADYAIWRLRGSPSATIEVTRFVVAPLKGSKEEYYPDGTTPQPCTQSLLPQGDQPCWWLSGNRVMFDR